MLKTITGVGAEDESQASVPVAFYTTEVPAANLADRADDEETTMSLDLERSRSSIWGEMGGGSGFRDERGTPQYGGENSWAMTNSSRRFLAVPRELTPSPIGGSRDRRAVHFGRAKGGSLETTIWPFFPDMARRCFNNHAGHNLEAS
jgi:hypothetical protein